MKKIVRLTRNISSRLITTGLLTTIPGLLLADWSGNITLQDRYFIDDALDSRQHDQYLSLSAEPEYFIRLGEDRSFTFTPFARLDQYDDERSHADIHELNYQQVFSDWELRVGISKVFWGVTESQHLVDVINQTDQVENIDNEDKLGQPMIRASFTRDWGFFDVFVLPYFRERSFQGIEGRPRTLLPVDTDQALYESSREEQHIDYALRMFSYLGDLEMGISWFTGTSREPLFLGGTKGTQSVLIPYYPLMSQVSIDAQYTTEAWLWKLEMIYRDWQAIDINSFLIRDENYVAATAGFEYTFVGFLQSDADLGLVMEYLYDERDKLATTPFQNDIMLGWRLAMNDAASSEALLGAIYDLDTHEVLASLEASRRYGDSLKASLEARLFNNIDSLSPLSSIRQDSLIQLELAWYF